MQIPPFMLKKIYVRGSLVELEGGVAFTLTNPVAPAHLVGINALTINGVDYTGRVTLKLAGRTIKKDEIDPRNALHFGLKEKAVIHIPGLTLEHGSCEIKIVLQTKEVGPLSIQASDQLSG